MSSTICSEHKEYLKENNPTKANDKKWIDNMHNKGFIEWFRKRVSGEYISFKTQLMYVYHF